MLPSLPSSNFTLVSINCSCLPEYSASSSGAYFSAINPNKINKKIIEIIFQEKKNGNLKTIGINSKKARGLITNFAIKNKISKPENLQEFDADNYRFNSSLSNNEKWFFTR